MGEMTSYWAKITGDTGLPTNELEKLRIRVAELLGWTEIESRELVHSPVPQLVGIKPGERPSQFTGYKPKHTLPNWPEKIEDAWELVEVMARDFQNVDVVVSPNKYGYQCHVGLRGVSDDAAANETAKSSPEAICRAFLKVTEASNNLE